MKTTSVEQYLIEGCMRCKFGATPECKVHSWKEELLVLREILLETSLNEEVKWGGPCYTYKEKNILTLSAFKGFVALGFFKGSLIPNIDNLLQKQGENANEGRIVKYTNTADISAQKEAILKLVEAAIEVESSGKTVKKVTVEDLDFPEELLQKFDELPALKFAFYALTPGRQKGYIYYFNQAKQSSTRTSRIVKCAEKIFEGKGWNDR